MASFEQRFYLENPSRWQALRRDARLLITLAGYALMWMGKGRKVRRAYQQAQARGEVLDLDELIGS